MKLKILPLLTGKTYNSLEEILKDKTAVKILWLEILFNDDVDWESYNNNEVILESYKKACVFYERFSYLLNRKPLKCIYDKVKEDEYLKDIRKFEEVLNFLT